ncbi:hypothetical protein [Accumulibacter sp.]|uniref:hypothetical protein n=1 Tax=Accumulibacter sp. TaxID=2053492 RepID=UPI0034590D7A
MRGNVGACCADGRHGYDERRQDPRGSERKEAHRVVRGGSWNFEAWRLRSASRMLWRRVGRPDDRGLRFARGGCLPGAGPRFRPAGDWMAEEGDAFAAPPCGARRWPAPGERPGKPGAFRPPGDRGAGPRARRDAAAQEPIDSGCGAKDTSSAWLKRRPLCFIFSTQWLEGARASSRSAANTEAPCHFPF